MITAPSGRQPVPDIGNDNTAEAAGPGALRGQAWLTLQTRQAQRLIRGRPAAAGKPAITGLFGFADRLRGIWQGARQDDPYADWWLLKLHDALVAAEQVIRAGQVTVGKRLASWPSLEVRVATSRKPYRTPLRFANPYAFRGARLLADYDEVARGVLTAAHLGLMDRDEAERLLGHGASKIRGVFCVPQGYRFLGVDRLALAQGTAVADQARKAMGEVPEEVLRGERRAPLGPRKAVLPQPLAGNPRLHPVAAPNPEAPVGEADGGGD